MVFFMQELDRVLVEIEESEKKKESIERGWEFLLFSLWASLFGLLTSLDPTAPHADELAIFSIVCTAIVMYKGVSQWANQIISDVNNSINSLFENN